MRSGWVSSATSATKSRMPWWVVGVRDGGPACRRSCLVPSRDSRCRPLEGRRRPSSASTVCRGVVVDRSASLSASGGAPGGLRIGATVPGSLAATHWIDQWSVGSVTSLVLSGKTALDRRTRLRPFRDLRERLGAGLRSAGATTATTTPSTVTTTTPPTRRRASRRPVVRRRGVGREPDRRAPRGVVGRLRGAAPRRRPPAPTCRARGSPRTRREQSSPAPAGPTAPVAVISGSAGRSSTVERTITCGGSGNACDAARRRARPARRPGSRPASGRRRP